MTAHSCIAIRQNKTLPEKRLAELIDTWEKKKMQYIQIVI